MADNLAPTLLSFGSTTVLAIILLMAAATFVIMWADFRQYRDEHWKRRSCIADFVKEEISYILVFAVFLVIIIVELAVLSWL